MKDQDHDKIIKLVQASTRALMDSFHEKADSLRECSADVKLLIREGYDKKKAKDAAIQTEFNKTQSYSETAHRLGIDERTVKKHVTGRNSPTLGTSHGSRTRTIAGNEAYDKETIKTLYREFRKGLKPNEVIETHGYPPAFVAAEYDQFNRNNDLDFIDFQERLILGIEDIVLNEKPSLKHYLDTFRSRGYLKNMELTDLLSEIL